MVFGGDCIGKINGKTVFVPFSLPGEKLDVKIVYSKRDYDVAEIIEVIEPSPHRVKPKCSLYGVCGGCNMMHIDEDYQRTLRIQILKDCLLRQTLEVNDIDCIHGNSFGYRNRFQLHDGGLDKRGTNESIDISECPTAVAEVNEYFKNVPKSERGKGRCHIFGGKSCTPKFTEVKSPEETRNTQFSKDKKRVGKHYIKPRFEGITQNDSVPVTAEILGKKIMFDAQGFFQSNLEVLEKTISLVVDGLKGENVLDMYSGSGTFSVFLKDSFSKVTLVEHNRGALVFAEQNLLGQNHESYGISGKKWVSDNAPSIIQTQGNFDAVVIDPPRSGMEREVLHFLCDSKIPYIRSLSCDPATHARDLAVLVNHGYVIEKLYLLDFYPQTSHIESLAYLRYNK